MVFGPRVFTWRGFVAEKWTRPRPVIGYIVGRGLVGAGGVVPYFTIFRPGTRWLRGAARVMDRRS